MQTEPLASTVSTWTWQMGPRQIGKLQRVGKTTIFRILTNSSLMFLFMAPFLLWDDYSNHRNVHTHTHTHTAKQTQTECKHSVSSISEDLRENGYTTTSIKNSSDLLVIFLLDLRLILWTVRYQWSPFQKQITRLDSVLYVFAEWRI